MKHAIIAFVAAAACSGHADSIAAPAVPSAAQKVWVRLAAENALFVLKAPSTVRFGAEPRLSVKVLPAGNHHCTNATFGGDPAPGTQKTCEMPVEIETTAAMLDRSGHGPAFNPALIPPPARGFDGPRVKSTWFKPGTGAACQPFAPGCVVGDHERINPNDIGAFREPCDFSHMAKDDPIVFPGQPGKAHLHTFFGNTGVNAFTTTESLGTGNSTCAGGTLNRTAYWVPSMIDTRTGAPIAPPGILAYYKGSYLFSIAKKVEPYPAGLRMISGDANNSDPAKTTSSYICMGPNGENPGHTATITRAVAKGTCRKGGTLIMSIPFPHCWDGINLDSPNHASHMAFPVFDAAKNTHACPATHPRVLPNMSFNIGYPIPDDDAVKNWKLSSDKGEAGTSGHGDYWFNWDEEINKAWTKACLAEVKDCHAYLLGDGRTLY